MGEFAQRLSDRSRVKIGTCEEMLYLRFEDRHQVTKDANSIDPMQPAGLFFRVPFPDEDRVQIGDYDNPDRAQRLYRGNADFLDESTVTCPGNIQLHHPCGLLVNVPCYHGNKLPDLGKDAKVFWNGKSWCFELKSLKAVKDENVIRVFPVVHCRHCRSMWRYDWCDILEFIPEPLRDRLRIYQERTF